MVNFRLGKVLRQSPSVTGPRIEQMLVDDPLLLRTPIVREGARATVGFVPEVWQAWIDESKT